MSTQVAIDAVLDLADQLKKGELGVTELVVVTNETASDDEEREKPTYEEDKRRILKLVTKLKAQLRTLEKRKAEKDKPAAVQRARDRVAACIREMNLRPERVDSIAERVKSYVETMRKHQEEIEGISPAGGDGGIRTARRDPRGHEVQGRERRPRDSHGRGEAHSRQHSLGI